MRNHDVEFAIFYSFQKRPFVEFSKLLFIGSQERLH